MKCCKNFSAALPPHYKKILNSSFFIQVFLHFSSSPKPVDSSPVAPEPPAPAQAPSSVAPAPSTSVLAPEYPFF